MKLALRSRFIRTQKATGGVNLHGFGGQWIFRGRRLLSTGEGSLVHPNAMQETPMASVMALKSLMTRPMEEILPLLAALYDRGDWKGAETVLAYCRQRRPQDWMRAVGDRAGPWNMSFNAALRAWKEGKLGEGSEDGIKDGDGGLEVLRAKMQQLRRDFGLDGGRTARTQPRPDYITFALLLKYVLGMRESCRGWQDDVAMIAAEAEDVLQRDWTESVLPEIKTGGILDVEELAILHDMFAEPSSESPRPAVAPKTARQHLGNADLPDIRAIDSKSAGITFIRDSLRKLDSATTDSATMDELYELQLSLEQDCYTAMLAKMRRDAEMLAEVRGNGNISGLRRELAHWHDALQQAIEVELRGGQAVAQTSDQSQERAYYVAIVSVLSSEKIATIVLQELLRMSLYEPYYSAEGTPMQAAKLVNMAMSIGTALQREVFAEQIRKKPFLERAELNGRQLARLFGNGTRALDRKMRRIYARLAGDEEARQEGWIPAWSLGLRTEVGVWAVSVAAGTLRHEGQPVLSHAIVHQATGRRLGVVQLSASVFTRLAADRNLAFVEAWAMPMIFPPKPWLTVTSGGYLTHRSTCVRLKEEPLQLALLSEAQQSGRLESILMGLDVLGRVPWRINTAVLRTAIALWNEGENVSEITVKPNAGVNVEGNSDVRAESDADADAGVKVDANSKTDASDTEASDSIPFRKKEEFDTLEAYRAHCRAAAEQRNARTRQHSMTCDTNYKLEIARTFAGRVFYLPHSVDFRGRAYPLPPHLSHLGSDLARGLLCFAEGKALGARGLWWLKVHWANMCGVDKVSLEERAAFTEAHIEDIRRTAADPLHPEAFWRSQDSAWQCLAASLELAAALECKDPSTYVSSLPVQQDGSCNGSQHYAALGGDVEGAAQVNLVPSAGPRDVYGRVASIVSRELERDLAEDSGSNTLSKTKPAEEDAALRRRMLEALKGRINRKIVKQPVMTNIYGVTVFGAKRQIEERLVEAGVFADVPAVERAQMLRLARDYLARRVFGALDELFGAARKIQDWLTYCAAEICRAVPEPVAQAWGQTGENTLTGAEAEATWQLHVSTWNPVKTLNKDTMGDPLRDRYPQTPVAWTTPLGFRVVQPYLKTSSVQLRTILQLCSLNRANAWDPVDAGKQIAAFPPNFIHSLDATHMFRTALACAEADVVFASVHDCFWTHAASVDDMSRILRQEFVALHTRPVLQELHEEFSRAYRGYKVPVLVREAGAAPRRVWRDVHFPPLPRRGTFDLSQVLESTYFFS